MTGQWVVDSLRLVLGYVEAHPLWTCVFLVLGGGFPSAVVLTSRRKSS